MLLLPAPCLATSRRADNQLNLSEYSTLPCESIFLLSGEGLAEGLGLTVSVFFGDDAIPAAGA